MVWGAKQHWRLFVIPTLVGMAVPVSAEEAIGSNRAEQTVRTVQSMMDGLFPQIEQSEAAFRSAEERARIDAVLEKMLTRDLNISFFAKVRNCAQPTLTSCRILNSEMPEHRELAKRYAVRFMTNLGLSGSSFGNVPLPDGVAEKQTNVHHWVNWSQCYQPTDFPRNAVACLKAYHPFSQPAPGFRAIFETRGDSVIALSFYISEPRIANELLAERAKLQTR